MLGLGDLKQTRFYQEAFADGQQIGEQIVKSTIKMIIFYAMIKYVIMPNYCQTPLI
jgi:hypothetical protein